MNLDDEISPVKAQKVSEWMKKDVTAVHTKTKIAEVMSIFVDKKLSVLPVIDGDGKLKGKIIDSDLMKLFFHKKDVKQDMVVGAGFDFGYFADSAGELMRGYKVTLSPGETVGQAARKMVSHGLTSIPVVDSKGTLIGVLNARDVMKEVMTKKRLGTVKGSELIGES
jgi:acetoin utilization protein AcuB